MWTIELVVILLMIGVNSVFAGFEIALASVSMARLKALVDEGRRGAAAAVRMKENMEGSLAVVQLGITLVGVIAAATGGAGAEERIQPWLRSIGVSGATSEVLAIVMIAVPLTIMTIIFGELVPKVFSIRNKEWVCLRLSPLMELFAWSTWPAVWFFETSVEKITGWTQRQWQPDGETMGDERSELVELKALAQMARTSRLIGLREERIIVNAVRLSSMPVRDIMLPAEGISMLYADDTVADCLLAAHHDMHTRFPVTEVQADPQQIIGYVNFKDIVSCLRLSPHEPNVRGILRPMVDLWPEFAVSTCLERLIRGHNHIALIRNAEGRVEGMITLEDILEELVGDIKDEYDRLPSHIVPSGTGWIVGGGAGLAQLRQVTGINLAPDTGMNETLSDWLAHHLKRPPHGGDVVRLNGLTVLVRKIRRHHLTEALLTERREKKQLAGPDA